MITNSSSHLDDYTSYGDCYLFCDIFLGFCALGLIVYFWFFLKLYFTKPNTLSSSNLTNETHCLQQHV